MGASIISCRNCKGSVIKEGNTTTKVVFHKFEACKSCRRSEGKESAIWFCSPECVIEFCDKQPEELKDHAKGFREGKIWY